MGPDVTSNESERLERAKIGRYIVYFALFVIGFIGLAAIGAAVFAPPDKTVERFNLIKDILTALLPVLGTWVGTVLAFYFSKDNFDAAAKQTSDLVRQLTPDQKLQATPVSEAMLSMTDPGTTKVTLDKSENQFILKELLENYTKSGRNRMPFVDNDGKVKYVIHRSIIDKYISEEALSGNDKTEELTLEEFLKGDQYTAIATAFGAVGRNDKLDAVKVQMVNNPDCSDVFVTEDGSKNSKALGWITNVILSEKSKV